jgi:prevent-host-death family protein
VVCTVELAIVRMAGSPHHLGIHDPPVRHLYLPLREALPTAGPKDRDRMPAKKRDSHRRAILMARYRKEPVMRFASVAEVKNQLSRYLAVSRRKREPIVITHHGKPYALIQPLSEQDLEELEWKGLAKRRLARAWEGEGDGLYDYL